VHIDIFGAQCPDSDVLSALCADSVESQGSMLHQFRTLPFGGSTCLDGLRPVFALQPQPAALRFLGFDVWNSFGAWLLVFGA